MSHFICNLGKVKLQANVVCSSVCDLWRDSRAFAYLDLCYISCLPHELTFANLGQVAQSRVE